MKNTPGLWIKNFPVPTPQDHKYSRGQVVVLGGADMTGAACLSADAAARIGAGLVTIISSSHDVLNTYRSFRSYIIVRTDVTIEEFVKAGTAKGTVASVIGPGLGNKEYKAIRDIIASVLTLNTPIVLDADGLNAFEGKTNDLWDNIHENTVITPHEGEFSKLFPDLKSLLKTDHEEAAKKAAEMSQAIVVLKGFETVIAAPNGQIIINDNASPYLATAGSGDVLSGMIAGLMGQGMNALDAACAAVWLHGKASIDLGTGLVATDLVEIIPELLKETLGIRKKVG